MLEKGLKCLPLLSHSLYLKKAARIPQSVNVQIGYVF